MSLSNTRVGRPFLRPADQRRASKWHSGEGAPQDALGRLGDFYIDKLTGDYFEKIADGWKEQGNLKSAAIEPVKQALEDHISQTAAHGTGSDIVGEADEQTLDNKTIDGGEV